MSSQHPQSFSLIPQQDLTGTLVIEMECILPLQKCISAVIPIDNRK